MKVRITVLWDDAIWSGRCMSTFKAIVSAFIVRNLTKERFRILIEVLLECERN